MNTTNRNEDLTRNQNLAQRCVLSCKKLLAGIELAKARIANEFHDTLAANEQLIQLALNEAEALARQTAYPHLLFPSLAMEKVQAVAMWQARQQSLHQRPSIFARAA